MGSIQKDLSNVESSLSEVKREKASKISEINTLYDAIKQWNDAYELRCGEVRSLKDEMQKWKKVDRNKFKSKSILEIRRSSKHVEKFWTQFGTINGLAYVFEKNEFANNIQFEVNSDSRFSYSIESSLDGHNWKTNGEFR